MSMTVTPATPLGDEDRAAIIAAVREFAQAHLAPHALEWDRTKCRETYDQNDPADLGWNLYTEVRTVSGLFVAADTPMQHYTLWNSRISYRPLPALELYAAAQNMLGKSYYINYGYRMPGCTMFGGLKVTF